jgi:chemotaxis regulatin CheY-phosphate phosphatase CheZ
MPAKSLDRAGAPDRQQTLKTDIEELRGRLAAIVAATSDAANTIIARLENVIAHSPTSDTQGAALDALSACVFHDIVGQHIARAAELLEFIEQLCAAGQDGQASANARAERLDALVHGPAITRDGLDQSAVDDFFPHRT